MSNANIPQEVLEEVDRELDERFADYPKGMGFCHIYWAAKREELSKRGYSWESPQEIANRDPHGFTIFD